MQSEQVYTIDAGRVRRYTRYMIGLITGLVGLADMLSAIAPKLNWSILLGAWPIYSHRVPAQTYTVVVGFFLIMLSYGLARGKHHAWRITLLLLFLSALLHVQRSGSVLATVVALLLATLLALLMRYFQAKSDPPSVRRGYMVLGLGLGIVAFYSIGGFLTLYNSFAPWVDRIGLENTILQFLTYTPLHTYSPLHVDHETPVFFFQKALPLLCISAILYGMVQIFRPVAAVLLPDTEERKKIAKLVESYGKNSISYFALSEEKTYFFAKSDKAVISYVLAANTAVVAGDPIGPDEEIPIVMKEFIDFCHEQDWTLAFWQIRDVWADLYRDAGFHLLKIGEDAVVNPQTFTLRGNKMATVREKAKRAEKDGLRIVVYRTRVTNEGYLAQMEAISQQWLAKKGGCEMGFSQGQFNARGDSEQLYALAIDDQQKVHAFMSFVPIYGRLGWSVDLMRRLEHTSPGTMYLLLSYMIEYLKQRGAEMLSMGLGPMNNTNAEGDDFVSTSVDFLTERFGNPSKNKSLSDFKQKFQPTWESRYLVYSGALSLPKIGWALYRAHQTEISLLGTVRKSLEDWHKQRQELAGKTRQELKTAQI